MLPNLSTYRLHFFEFAFKINTSAPSWIQNIASLSTKITEIEAVIGEEVEKAWILKISSINIFRDSILSNFDELWTTIEPIKKWVRFNILELNEYLHLYKFKVDALSFGNFTITDPKCAELDEESKLREDQQETLVRTNAIGSSIGFGISDFQSIIESKDKVLSEYRLRNIPKFNFRFAHESLDSEKLNKLFKYFSQFTDENDKSLWRDFGLISHRGVDIFALSTIHEAIGYGGQGIAVELQLGTFTDPSTNLTHSDKFSQFEANKMYFVKKAFGTFETSFLSYSKVFLNEKSLLTKVGDFYIISCIEAICGTISSSHYEISHDIKSWLESDHKQEGHIIVPENQITSVICRSFLVLKQLVIMNIPRMIFEVNLKDWCDIQYTSEADIILELPKSSYICLKVYSQDSGKFPEKYKQLNTFSHEPRVLPKEEREALIIYTKMFLDNGCKSIEFADVFSEKDSKNILAHLIDPNCLNSVSMINPIFKLTPIIMNHLLKQKNIFNLEIYSKGKDYLSEVIRARTRNAVHRYFYKNIMIEYQLPIHIQTFSNATVM